MADSSVLYFRFPGDVFSDFPTFASEARALLEIEESILKGVADELASYPGFLGEAAMKKVILRHLPDEERAGRLARVLAIADAITRDGKGPDRLLDRLTRARFGPEGQEQPSLSADEAARLRKVLQLVGRAYPGRARQAKAERLGEAVGLRAEALDLICDLRPVFDEARTRIEGVIPLTTLRVVVRGVDKIPLSFEVVLSAGDVQDLLKKAEGAVRKLNVLGELAERNNLPVPAIDLTETRD